MINKDTNIPSTTEPLSFGAIPLSPPLVRAVAELNYTQATDIQAAAIPFLLDGADLIGRSRTGTGKTAAFGIPAVESVDGALKRPQVLVLSPTRELALQIAREMQKYAKYKEGVSVATIYGGASMGDQIRQLKHANIVIGTPGRLMDHLRRRTLKMDDLKMVVLDEADEMLSMGFIEDIQTILSSAPTKRQTALFSATMPPPILKISREFLIEPKIVDVMAAENSQTDIEQTFYFVSQHKKQDALILLLRHADFSRAIVFCNTKSMVDELTESLGKQGFRCCGLHGDMAQPTRTKVMQNFRNGAIQILIATDVAARGIDVNDVDAVINFDLPSSFDYYIHRIGRTGRAGRPGLSQTLICNKKQLAVLGNLMKVTGSSIKEHRLPTGKDLMACAVEKQAAELLPTLQTAPGQAATMLVNRLMNAQDGSVTAEQIACALAEKLMGGDEKYASLLDAEIGRKSTDARHRRERDSEDAEFGAMVNVVANIGRNARVTPNHFVGAITEQLDTPGSSIGKIVILQYETIIGLREEVAELLLHRSKPIRINGGDVTFTARQSSRGSRSTSARSPRDKQYSKRRNSPTRHS